MFKASYRDTLQPHQPGCLHILAYAYATPSTYLTCHFMYVAICARICRLRHLHGVSGIILVNRLLDRVPSRIRNRWEGEVFLYLQKTSLALYIRQKVWHERRLVYGGSLAGVVVAAHKL